MTWAMPVWMPGCFFLIALAYSLVGFGGGSSYLAILVLAGVPFTQLAPTALICNLVVTAGGCWHFYRAGYLKFRNVWPFIVTSVPMAYLGGRTLIAKELFLLLLGLSLLAVSFRMLLSAERVSAVRNISWKQAWLAGPFIGGFIGFLSGVIGIGGGIFLSPLLLLIKWVNVKESAAVASFFIVVNSIAGLVGQWQKGNVYVEWILPLAIAVFAGGQIGSRMGAYKIPMFHLQKILAVLILCVSIKILIRGL